MTANLQESATQRICTQIPGGGNTNGEYFTDHQRKEGHFSPRRSYQATQL